MDRIHVTFAGTKEMQRRLLGMAGSVQGAVIRPIVAESAGVLKDLMVSLAPKRTGALAGGLIADLMKIGFGYCYYWVRLAAAVYYGVFQEFGLGTGRSGGESARVKRRRENYEVSLAIRKRMLQSSAAGLASYESNMLVLGKREFKRQKKLQEGKYIQGQRRPNMAAHPFMRPAVKFLRTELAVRMLEGAAANILRWTESGR